VATTFSRFSWAWALLMRMADSFADERHQ